MISLYSGTPGSGKSLHIARRVYYSLKIGQTVYCNFEINMQLFAKMKQKPKFHYVPNWELTPAYLIGEAQRYFEKHKRREDVLLLVIDECQLIFNAREWNAKGRNEWLSFFTQHRKYGYEIVLVAQFDNMIDKQIRSLIEYEIIHRKLSNFGIKGKLLSLFFGGNTFVAVRVWYPMNERIDSEFFHAKRKLFKLYDTYGTFKIDAKKDTSSG